GQFLWTLGALSFLSLAACQKAVPVASKPNPPAPVTASAARTAPSAPAPTPAPSRAATTRATTAQPASRTMPPDVRAALNERLARLEDALFDFDKYTIRQDATTALRDDVGVIRDILATYPSQKLVIEGHADERGSSEYNIALGDKRAHAA